MTYKNHPLSRDQLIGAIIAYEGYATADGALGGTSVIDAGLIGANDFLTGKECVITSGLADRETKTATSFNTVTGEITFPAFSSQILTGTTFKIITAGSGGALTADLLVPAADAAANVKERDVLGNKSDAAVTTVGVVASVIAYIKGLLNRIGAPAGASVSADIAAVQATMTVPAADAATNTNERDVAGNKSDAAVTTVGTAASEMAYTKAILNYIGQLNQGFMENWKSEPYINDKRWITVNPLTGTAWAIAPSALGILRASAVPALSGSASLTTLERWNIIPATFGIATLQKKTILEFSFKLTGIANVDQTKAFIGFMSGQTDDRTAQNLVGFGFNAGALVTITDNGGAETTNTGFGETLTNPNKGKIVARAGAIDFYLNETLVATHVTNLPNGTMYFRYYILNGAGGASTPEIGMIRIDNDPPLLDQAWIGRITDQLALMQGGAETNQSLADRLDSELDLARSAQSAAWTMDGTEQTVYEEGTLGDLPWFFGGCNFDFSNLAVGDIVIIRMYLKNVSAGTYRQLTLDANYTFNGVQTPALFTINETFYNQYSVKITLQQTAHPVSYKVIQAEEFDAKRGA